MSYDPIEYWKKEGREYHNKFRYNDTFRKQEQELINYLRTIEFKSVLELGCGFGRITKLILDNFDVNRYVAVDVSPDQLGYAAKTIDYDGRVQFILSDIESLEINRQYDLVIAIEFLMHQLPSKIHQTVARMIRWSKGHVINLDYYVKNPPILAPHNFVHDYLEIYNHDANRLQMGDQAIFHLQRNDLV